MYVSVKSKDKELWTVGHYAPSGQWEPESDHPTAQDAAERVRFLNGGSSEEPSAVLGDFDRSLAKLAEQIDSMLSCVVAIMERIAKSAERVADAVEEEMDVPK